MSFRPRNEKPWFETINPASTAFSLKFDSEAHTEWWGGGSSAVRRREERSIPRKQLFVFNPELQAKPELYAFVHDENETISYFTVSRLDGASLGSVEADQETSDNNKKKRIVRVSADVSKMKWTRRAAADYEVEFVGDDGSTVMDGYVKRTAVRDSLEWVIVVVKIFGSYLAAASDRNVLSLPLYTALASGVDFAINSSGFEVDRMDADKADGEDGADVGEAAMNELAEEFPDISTVPDTVDAVDAVAEAAAELTIAVDAADEEKKPDPEPVVDDVGIGLSIGRAEIGSDFKSHQRNDAARGVELKSGDTWTIVRPWDANAAIDSTVARFDKYVASRAAVAAAVRVTASEDSGGIGVVFPLSANSLTSDGVFIHKMEIEATPVRNVLGKEVKGDANVHRVRFLDASDTVVAAADVVPEFETDHADSNQLVVHRFIATPTVGSAWPSKRRSEGTTGGAVEAMTYSLVSAEEVVAVQKGVVAPWSPQIIAAVEKAIAKMRDM